MSTFSGFCNKVSVSFISGSGASSTVANLGPEVGGIVESSNSFLAPLYVSEKVSPTVFATFTPVFAKVPKDINSPNICGGLDASDFIPVSSVKPLSNASLPYFSCTLSRDGFISLEYCPRTVSSPYLATASLTMSAKSNISEGKPKTPVTGPIAIA